MQETTQLGTAKWEDDSSIIKKFRFEEGKFWLGRSIENNSAPIGYLDDRHICLVSGTRGGKGASVIVNNLCLYKGSVVVVDPKGENATVTAARRGEGSEHCKGMGQKVYVLDPFQTTRNCEQYQCSFNPLKELNPNDEDVIDKAADIADAIIVTGKKSNPFWDEQARDMLQGLILHVLTSPVYKGERNLVTVRKLISSGNKKLYQEMIDEGHKPEHLPSPQTILWQSLQENEAFGGIIAEIGDTFFELKENANETFQGVLSSLTQNTSFINSPKMRKSLLKSDFKLSELKKNPNGVSLYLSLPQSKMKKNFRWLRMVISLITTEMETVKEKPATGKRILMILDEFAGLKRMKVIEDAVAQIAGFGVTLFFVVQSLEQLKATYENKWENFLGNAGLKIFFSIEDHFTREYISKFVGDTEIIVESSSEGKSDSENFDDDDSMSYQKFLGFRYNKSYTTANKGGGKGENEERSKAPQKRRLIEPNEVGKIFSRVDDKKDAIYPGLALVLISGQNPFPVKRANYYQDKHFHKKFNPHPDHKTSNVEIPLSSPDKKVLEYLRTSSEVRIDIPDDHEINTGSTYMNLHISDDFSNLDNSIVPFVKLGKTLEDTFFKDYPKTLKLEATADGRLLKLGEDRAVISTDNPEIDDSIEKQNHEKIGYLGLGQQGTYRMATLILLGLTTFSVLFVFYLFISLFNLVIGNESVLWTPFEAVDLLYNELTSESDFWYIVLLIPSYIAYVAVFLGLVYIVFKSIKLPKEIFSIASKTVEYVFECPISNPRFDKFDKDILKPIFENSFAKMIIDKP